MEEVDHIYMLQKYPFVSKEELVEIQETQKYPTFCKTVYESIIRWHSDQRKKQSIMGREGMLTGPLVYLLSAQIQTLNFDANKPITVFGRIHLEFSDVSCAKSIVHELYGQSCDDPQILVGPSRSLALTSPDYTSETVLVCMSSNVPKLVVDVTVGGERFSGEKLCCTQVEQVKQEFFYGEFGGSLALRYISIPFAVYGRVEVKFIRKQDHSFDENGSHFIDVKGKVVARYCNTFGRFDSEECTLYDKEFERVTINDKRGMENVRITRPWIAVPIYSSLIIDLDLSECGTDRKLLKEKVQVPIDKWCGKKIIIDDEYVIALYVAWFYPVPQGRCAYDMMELEDESSNDNDDDDDNDDEMSSNGSGSEECDDEHMSERISGVASSPSRRLCRFLHPHGTMPSSSPAMEVFSVFVGREQFEPFRVYGCIEVVSDAFKFQVFRKEADDALDLLHDGKILTLLDGPRVFDECCSLEIKVDLKDFENRLHIKGYVEWDQRDLGGSSWLEKQLCSVVQSNLGFAAIHYSFFPRAVQATIGIFCTAKKHGNDDNIYPEFYGSIVARYGSYDYTSQYNKDYYQIVIFQRNEGNRAQSQSDSDGLIPLSRSKVVVPLNSSLVIEANLHNNIFSQVLNDYVEFSVGIKNGKKMTVDGDGYSIEIGLHVKWGEVSE
ncbi:hypothetical protein OROHE_023833 [Orobanche hederae]